MRQDSEQRHTEHFLKVGDVVLIEVRRTFKNFEIIANFGRQEVREGEGTKLRDESLACRAQKLADKIMPYNNIAAVVVMGSTCPQEPIARVTRSAVFLSQDKGTGELDIVDTEEVEIIYGTAKGIGEYMDEVRDRLQSGLEYYYLLAQVVAVAETTHTADYRVRTRAST